MMTNAEFSTTAEQHMQRIEFLRKALAELRRASTGRDRASVLAQGFVLPRHPPP
jgi:hypothetical protein